MLVAVGIGGKNAIPAAAGLSWVLKDGLGRLGRLLYVAVYGSTFDCSLKVLLSFCCFRFFICLFFNMFDNYCFLSDHMFEISLLQQVRYCTSILFTLSMGIETVTPLFPKFFLPLAAVANVGKSIGFAAYLATTVSFSLKDKLINFVNSLCF